MIGEHDRVHPSPFFPQANRTLPRLRLSPSSRDFFPQNSNLPGLADFPSPRKKLFFSNSPPPCLLHLKTPPSQLNIPFVFSFRFLFCFLFFFPPSSHGNVLSGFLWARRIAYPFFPRPEAPFFGIVYVKSSFRRFVLFLCRAFFPEGGHHGEGLIFYASRSISCRFSFLPLFVMFFCPPPFSQRCPSTLNQSFSARSV